jgi:FkbM family methyltransferase
MSKTSQLTSKPGLMRRIAKLWLPPIVQDGVRVLRQKRSIPQGGLHEFECLGLRWRLAMDSLVAQTMLATGVWEKDTTDVVLDLVKPGMRVLSVGANFGYFALLMARRVGLTGHVWAFEPVKHFRDQLTWNMTENGLSDQVTVVPFGLSDKTTEAIINIEPATASLHEVPHHRYVSKEKIKLVTLDSIAVDLGIDSIDFLSLDIDGHEPAFLRGARSTLTRNLPSIALEFCQEALYYQGSDVHELAAILKEMGYEICSEKTRTPFASEIAFLKECGNYGNYSNALALPKKAPEIGI